MQDYPCPKCSYVAATEEELIDHALEVHNDMREITWADFKESDNDPHQWFFNDDKYETRYALRKTDGVIEASIREKLVSDPTEKEVEAKIAAFNAHRKHQALSYKREDYTSGSTEG